MTVRLRIALTILATGLVSALGVIATVALAFQRFEHETTYDRANAFLGRVVSMYDDILDRHQRQPDEFGEWLRSLLLFEPETQLYLLAVDGKVLASTGHARLPAGYTVALGPVRQAVDAAQGERRAPYVMGDDPEHMSADAVITARALTRAVIRSAEPVAGYLYLVSQKRPLAAGRLDVFRSSLAGPALAAVAAVIAVTTLLAAWIIAGVTRPLHVLSAEVDAAARDGFSATTTPAVPPVGAARDDEFGRLRRGFRAMLATLHAQWDKLRALDQWRREGVSNLSHDLRSPLTATTACLETLHKRWTGDPAHAEDARLVEVALRNTRNAAHLVRSLGDLAKLDEPEFRLELAPTRIGELLDDIALRFAERAAEQGIALCHVHAKDDAPPLVAVDIELLERALANLIDNALKFTARGGSIRLGARMRGAVQRALELSVQDSGRGIVRADIAHLFDRLYQGQSAAAEGDKGLGLAIVKRIAELHGGKVEVDSTVGHGTEVRITLPLR